jgi:DNA-directed RNA polymerase specialized sigma24 family protein
MGVFEVLGVEWLQIGATPAARQHLARWGEAEPALGRFATPIELVDVILTRGDPNRSCELLGCLLRLADDPFAARTLLQALAPGLRHAARTEFWPRRGIWTRLADTEADVVAAAWETIRARAGQTVAYPAREVIGAARRRLRSTREAHDRRNDRTAVVDVAETGPPADMEAGRSMAERFAARLIDAVRTGSLPTRQARLLYATAVVGLRPVEVGEIEGLQPRTVYYALAKAQAALARESA